MTRFMLVGAFAVGISTAAAPSAAAQSCLGFAPFANGPTRVSGDLGIADEGTAYGASVMIGRKQPGVFGGGSISGTRFDRIKETGKNVGLSAGFSVPLGARPATEFCPVADVVHTWGPDVGDVRLTSNMIGLGAAVGHPYAATQTLTLVPFADVRWVHVSGHAESPLGASHGSDSFTSVAFGSGIMFSPTVTLRPAVAIDIGEDDAYTTFLLTFAFHLGT